MRRTTYIPVLVGMLLFGESQGQAQWEKINSNSNSNLLSTCVFGAEKYFIVGDSGTILYSIDKGISWSASANITKNRLNAIVSVDPNNGFIVGSSGIILKTADQGMGWDVKYGDDSIDLNSISCEDDSTCIAVGSSGAIRNGVILKTKDAGATWDKKVFPLSSIARSMHPSNGFTSIVTIDSNRIFVTGDPSPILRFQYSDTSLTAMDSNYYGLYDIEFTGPSLGYAVGWDYQKGGGMVLVSKDNGPWIPRSPQSRSQLNSAAFVSDTLGFAAGNEGIFETWDGGRSWPSLIATGSLNSIRIYEKRFGLIVGERGLILRSDDILASEPKVTTIAVKKSLNRADLNKGILNLRGYNLLGQSLYDKHRESEDKLRIAPKSESTAAISF